jgi:NCAIR mutase (PurE)-related protein
MERHILEELLAGVRDGRIDVDDALAELRDLPFTDLGTAHVDGHRSLRCGFPEVIFGPGKTPKDVVRIAAEILRKSDRVLMTRLEKPQIAAVTRRWKTARVHARARAVTIEKKKRSGGVGRVVVVSAGTSDIPVAEEAAVTAEITGSRVTTLYDVGVAGLHRLLGRRKEIQAARVVVCVAGMEGALPSVVAGLTDRPVVACPTSIGYGASFGGIAALLAMLNACAAGVAVVNIDNGFGAGYLASSINRLGETAP